MYFIKKINRVKVVENIEIIIYNNEIAKLKEIITAKKLFITTKKTLLFKDVNIYDAETKTSNFLSDYTNPNFQMNQIVL